LRPETRRRQEDEFRERGRRNDASEIAQDLVDNSSATDLGFALMGQDPFGRSFGATFGTLLALISAKSAANPTATRDVEQAGRGFARMTRGPGRRI